MFDNHVTDVLIKVLDEYGLSIIQEPSRFESILRDYLSKNPKELYLLSLSVKDDLFSELPDLTNHTDFSIVLEKMRFKLQSTYMINESSVEWVIEVWSHVLSHYNLLPKEIIHNQDKNIDLKKNKSLSSQRLKSITYDKPSVVRTQIDQQNDSNGIADVVTNCEVCPNISEKPFQSVSQNLTSKKQVIEFLDCEYDDLIYGWVPFVMFLLFVVIFMVVFVSCYANVNHFLSHPTNDNVYLFFARPFSPIKIYF